jgi:hypothetical protein
LQKLGQAIEPEVIEDPPNALAYEAD